MSARTPPKPSGQDGFRKSELAETPASTHTPQGPRPVSPPSLAVRYLTIRQICRIVHRCPRTVRRWIRQGDLPGTRRVKDGYLVPADALDKLLVPVDEAEDALDDEGETADLDRSRDPAPGRWGPP